MTGSGRRKRSRGSKAVAVHPPHQIGKRASREELINAIKDARRSKDSVEVVLSELGHATDKRRYFADHSDLPGAADRERSATATVSVTTDWIRGALHRRIDVAKANQASASKSRLDHLGRELMVVLGKNPAASAKAVYRALELRVGRDGSPISGIAGNGIHWVDRRGRRRVTSFETLASRLTRLRRKIRDSR